ncbi:MAG TPA: twin-arginine translocase TatA/TatE family subunit [Rubrobacteraceae bacterium]|nr:twin-arginine translocase TatA/TatE family subunit [Rubrobacteraceae bacterium]
MALIPVIPSIGGTELIILLAIVLLLFGAKRIPELARGLGTGIREFKRGTRGEGEDEVLREEKKGEELTAGAGEDTNNARTQEVAARAERAEQKR